MATYESFVIESDPEMVEFTEADQGTMEFEEAELEEFEAETSESDLESINAETVAEQMEFYSESMEANGAVLPRRVNSASAVNRQMLKTFTIFIKKLILSKIMNNPRARAKLQAATRQGPTAIARLLLPIVSKALPSYLRWLAPIYVPPVTRALFNPIRVCVGVKLEECEASPEEWSTVL